MSTMNRKEFLFSLGTGAVAAGCSTLLSACAGLSYATGRMVQGEYEILLGELEGRSWVMVDLGGGRAPALVTTESGTPLAISLRCTHRGCTVEPEGEELECPCHGSRYTMEGKLLGGPAPRDLETYPVRQEDGALYIRVR
jgi:cytochrome b6-f complex iron-sulfur subunit